MKCSVCDMPLNQEYLPGIDIGDFLLCPVCIEVLRENGFVILDRLSRGREYRILESNGSVKVINYKELSRRYEGRYG